MGRNTNAPFSTFISARLPSLAFMASANALGIRTARLFPHLQNSTIIPPLQGVDTVYIHDGSTAGKGPTPRHHDGFTGGCRSYPCRSWSRYDGAGRSPVGTLGEPQCWTVYARSKTSPELVHERVLKSRGAQGRKVIAD